MPYKDPARQRQAQADWYQNNKARHLEHSAQRKRALTLYVREVKEASPCADCGEQYPYYVMQFDHTGTDKVLSVAALRKQAGIERVKAEIAKCDVVCANCHAVRTWKRLHE